MRIITSKDNNQIKEIKKLSNKKYRDEKNQFIIEGVKLIKEAIQEKANIKQIVICEECITNNLFDKKFIYEVAKYDCVYVSKNIFLSLTDVKTPQGILAIIEQNETLSKIDFSEEIIVILDDIQDPGNLGTILRTLDSANLKQIVISKNTADPYNPKVVRSTMGAIFRVNIVRVENLEEIIRDIQNNEFEVVTTALDTDKSLYDIKLNKKAIIIGNEANGVSKELQKISDIRIKIPMLGKTESLNASVATGVIVYEYIRQKIK